jgi:hypothetical protein
MTLPSTIKLPLMATASPHRVASFPDGFRLPHDLPKQDWLAGRLGRHLWHHLHALGAAAGLVDGRCVAA